MAFLAAFISGVSVTSARADSAAHVAGKGKYCKERQSNGYLDCFFTSLDACQRRLCSSPSARSWTASRLEALENAAAQLIAAYTDSVVIQAERQILRSALRGSYWRAVGRWVGGALLYTFLLLAFAIGLAKSGIDLGGLYQKIVSLH